MNRVSRWRAGANRCARAEAEDSTTTSDRTSEWVFRPKRLRDLLLAQRLQRIDFGSPARRQITGEHCQCCQKQGSADQQAQITRTDLKGGDKNGHQSR